VKSAQQMVITAGDLQRRRHRVPLLVGGAALSEKFTRTRSRRVWRSRLLRQGRHDRPGLMNRLMDPAEREATCTTHHVERPGAGRGPSPERRRPVAHRRARSAKVRTDIPIPPAPYLDRKVRDVPHLAEVVELHQSVHALRRHLGYKGNFEKAWPGTSRRRSSCITTWKK
jgi:5-methyltetrahydrofolate--homocysteine methyltransferase